MKTEQSQTKQQYCVSKWKARKRKPHDSLCLSPPTTAPGCHLCFPMDICFILPSLQISFLCCFMHKAAYKPHSSHLCVVTETNQVVTCPFVLHSEHIMKWHFSASFAVQFSSVSQSCPTLWDPMDCSTQGFPVYHQLCSLLKLTSIESVMPSSYLILCPPAPNPSQHQSLFQWVNSSHEVAKVLECQLQHQSFQWTPRTDLL